MDGGTGRVGFWLSLPLEAVSDAGMIWLRIYLLMSCWRCLKFWLKLRLEEKLWAEKLLLSVRPTVVLFFTLTAR